MLCKQDTENYKGPPIFPFFSIRSLLCKQGNYHKERKSILKEKSCYYFIRQKRSSISKIKCFNPGFCLPITRIWNLSTHELLGNSTHVLSGNKILKCNLLPYTNNKWLKSHEKVKHNPGCSSVTVRKSAKLYTNILKPSPSFGIINGIHWVS